MSRQGAPDEHDGAIIVGGKPVLVCAPVRTWLDSGLLFKGLRARKYTRQIYLHWTGGENEASQTFATLAAKRASVQFLVDAHATVWQFCDANRECGHARDFNAESVGIEITSRGDDARVKDKHYTRRDVIEMVHGKHVRYGDFSDAQKEAVLQLVEALCRAYGVPMTVPLDAHGEVIAEVIPAADLARYHGVVGHYHTRKTKTDPAPRILRLVRDRGIERGLG